MKIFRYLLLASAALFLFTACQQRPTPPTPDITAGGPGGGRGATGDYLSPEDMRRNAGLGLESRNGAFGDGQREEGILPSVYFDFDQHVVRPEDRPRLLEASQFLSENPDANLIVEGHCDWRGTTEYNLALGERRANSVRDYLVSLGVAPGRIETVSFGDRMAATEASEQQMQYDRRADLVVVR